MQIEFLKEGHTYLVDGIPAMSVTKIVGKIFPRKYEGVPVEVLQKAANYGTTIHELLEEYITKRNQESQLELLLNGINYDVLETQHKIEPEKLEQAVAYIDDDIPLFVGRFDMLAEVQGERTLLDFKTTYKCDKDMLAWQLSMYAMALEQMQNVEIKKLACLWFPKNQVGQYVSVKRLNDDDVLREVKKVLGV